MINSLCFIENKNDKNSLNRYQSFFKGFNLKSREYIDPQQSNYILSQIKSAFSDIEVLSETIENASESRSELINDVIAGLRKDEKCFVFTDEVVTNGMFIATSSSVLQACLGIAFLSFNNECFVADSDFTFLFTIKYYDDSDSYSVKKMTIR